MTRQKVIFQKLPSGILFINLAKRHGDWKEVNFREQPLRKKTSGQEWAWEDPGTCPVKRVPWAHDCLLHQEAFGYKWQKIQIKLTQKIRTILTNLTESWKVDPMLQETKSSGSDYISCEFFGSDLGVLTSSSEWERCLCNSHPLLTLGRGKACPSCVSVTNVSPKSLSKIEVLVDTSWGIIWARRGICYTHKVNGTCQEQI